jgi:hypothetical protein
MNHATNVLCPCTTQPFLDAIRGAEWEPMGVMGFAGASLGRLRLSPHVAVALVPASTSLGAVAWTTAETCQGGLMPCFVTKADLATLQAVVARPDGLVERQGGVHVARLLAVWDGSHHQARLEWLA